LLLMDFVSPSYFDSFFQLDLRESVRGLQTP